MHVNVPELLFNLFGGLGLFLFGMRMMSEGLQKVAGDKLRAIFNMVTTNRFAGLFTGFLVTAIIQSSSATTVMLVGFVNAGLMSLQQAIHVILGANIGTTFTGWIIAFKITHYGLPLIASGAALLLFSRAPRVRYIGEVILGLGMLFFGLELMKDGFAPLRDEPSFHNFFMMFGAGTYLQIILSVLAGCLLTVVLQSSSATVGITMGLASQGLLSFPAAAALILGENIGTTVTALISSIGTGVNARRTALAHTLFNVIGVSYMIAIFPFYIKFVEWVVPGKADLLLANGTKPNIMAHIAASHTIFNITNVIVFLPFTILLANMVTRLIKDKPEAPGEQRLVYLNYEHLGVPSIMIGEARREIERMFDMATMMFMLSREYLFNSDKPNEELRTRCLEFEKHVDSMQDDIVKFLTMVNRGGNLSDNDIQECRICTRVVDETESIGDYCRRLVKITSIKQQEGLSFSDEALGDLTGIYDELTEFLSQVKASFLMRKQNLADDCEVRRKRLNTMISDARAAHVARLREGKCDVMPGIYFNNILNNLRRLRSHATNIVEASMGLK